MAGDPWQWQLASHVGPEQVHQALDVVIGDVTAVLAQMERDAVGPAGQGLSPESGLPVQWSATKNIAFKAELSGTGTSSPIVIGELVIVTSQSGSYETGDGSDPRLARLVELRRVARAERKVAIADRLLERTRQYGLPDHDVFIDCLTFTLGSGDEEFRGSAEATKLLVAGAKGKG